MKKLAIFSLCVVLLLAVCAYSAAADISVLSAFNANNPLFGSDRQDASNPNADDEDDRIIHVTGSVQLGNNGTSNVTVSAISVTPKTTEVGQLFTVLDLNITLVAPVIIPAGGAAPVALKARIPENLDAVNTNLDEVAFSVATITLQTGSGGSIATITAYMQRENHLLFDKAYVKINDDSNSVDDDDKIKDIKPGDFAEVEIQAENTYDDKDDIEIEDVELLVLVDDRDLDVDEDADLGDIGPDEIEEEAVQFDIEEDVGDGNYDLEITIEGEDEHGAKHGEKIDVELQVEKNRHEIKIDSMTAAPTTVSCGDKVEVEVEVSNIGKSDEDEVTIQIFNSDLEIDTRLPNIQLDEGDSAVKTFELAIPKDAEIGSKAFTVVTYYDYNEESTRDVFAVELESCDTGSSSSSGDSGSTGDSGTSGTTDTAPPATTSGTTTAQTVTGGAATQVTTTSGDGDSLRDSSIYIVLLILAIVIVIAVGAVLIVKMVVVK